MTSDLRPEVVRILAEMDLSQPLTDTEAEWLWNSTAEERRAVADHHARAAERLGRQAEALRFAYSRLSDFWYGRPLSQFRLGVALKIAPADVTAEIIQRLRDAGFSEDDGLPAPTPDEGIN